MPGSHGLARGKVTGGIPPLLYRIQTESPKSPIRPSLRRCPRAAPEDEGKRQADRNDDNPRGESGGAPAPSCERPGNQGQDEAAEGQARAASTIWRGRVAVKPVDQRER